MQRNSKGRKSLNPRKFERKENAEEDIPGRKRRNER
jgi:hypothetical protein